MADDRKVIIIAGPNGAGKTTFAREFLPNEADCPVFVNADLIAAGLAPFAPETAAVQAGRLMLQELARHFTARTSFAFETTLSGRAYLRHIGCWQAAGYRVKLIFLKLDTVDKAIVRVAQRVIQGGTISLMMSSSDASMLAWKTFQNITRHRWMPGHCMTTPVFDRCYSTGVRNHEPTTSFTGTRC